MLEIWVPIRRLEGLYDVSNLGRVRRVKAARGTRAGKIVKPLPIGRGYRCFKINVKAASGRWKTRGLYIHHCVAEAFIGPRPDGMEVNHIDTDKTNNRADNLEYTTPTGNKEHAKQNGLQRRPSSSV